MSLLYLAGSLLGIALLVGLNYLLFGRTIPDVGGADAIAARLAREVPGFRPGRFLIAADRRAALIEDGAHSTIFFVEALGDGIVIRKLERALLNNVGRRGAELFFTLADFSLPRATLLADSEDEARAWQVRLAA